jgi:beta-glucosidase
VLSLDRHRSFSIPAVVGACLACALGAASSSTLAGAPATVHPQQWPHATWPLPDDPALEGRVAALLAKMSLEEKVGQVIQADINSITPEDVRKYRLGSILAGGNSKPGGKLYASAPQWQALADAFYRASVDTTGGHTAIPVLFGIDAVHGHNNALGATLYPQNSALGATGDVELIRAIGAATAEEVRATGINWTFAPTLAVPQDIRWGRTYEGYSENPALVAQYATAMVEGLQGRAGEPGFLDASHVLATAKHFLGDGGTKNGKDQGDAQVSETELRDVHGAGYPPAIAAGVQTVMASFSSWNGLKMHGNRELLTDVLKERMGFAGFVVGDWNGHGQVPGCSNEDCPASINAGVDMLMAPDSWRGLYEHTLAEAKSGAIPRVRLDDAVSRILRVKLRMGLFDAGMPSAQPLAVNAAHVMGSPAHRALARRAVRESLVLIKNQGGLLPLDPRKRILVAGDAADSISRQSGGWTLTWQGVGVKNTDFPGAQSIWAGMDEQVKAAGGEAELSPDGHYGKKPDVAIVVFGEDPYAEFQGDIPDLSYRPGDDRDLELIRHLRAQGVPVVAVFLSGRPLWVNREINAADAFVAAWLPGSEGGGIADVLLRTGQGGVAHDFHGKLAYAWPRTAVQSPLKPGQKGYDPQFPYGYGLTYADRGDLSPLPEVSGISGDRMQSGLYFNAGKAARGYTLGLFDAHGGQAAAGVAPAATADGGLRMTAVDYKAQEDARRFIWTQDGAGLTIQASTPQDLDRETNGDVMLVTTLRIDAIQGQGMWIGVGCGTGCQARVDIGRQLAGLPHAQWLRVGMPLKCLRHAGANMHKIDRPFVWAADRGTDLTIARVALGTDVDHVIDCPVR